MMLVKTNTQTNPAQVGQFISQSECSQLKADFRESFPNEVTSVNIKAAALQTLLNNDKVSGIRFMYGLNNVDDAASRVIILMPCNFAMQGNIPNVMFNKNGFFDQDGDIISLDDACAKQVNHVFRLKRSNPAVAYTKVLRGYFLGKEVLQELLDRVTDEYITYSFGYDDKANATFKPILTPVNGGDDGVDHGKLCPPDNDCGEEGFTTCVATYVAQFYAKNQEGELNTLRAFRDVVLNENHNSAAIEKYYTISASIMERLHNDAAKADVTATLYNNYFKTSVASLLAGDKAEAFKLFEDCMQYLTDKYLYQ